jgi:hypothetical protein
VPITVTSEVDLIELTVSFDDTPGLECTKFNKRAENRALISKYAEENFADIPGIPNNLKTRNTQQKTYPNVILIVASWNSIEEDNEAPGTFTSSIGKTIDYLPETGLVDERRQNIIVVVTKSLSFWDDYEDFESEDDKNDQWKRDAEEKRRIVDGLRVKAFPSSSPWPVVFAENGGGTSAKPRTLPNGDVYPQNLFERIKELFAHADADGVQDLVGIATLQYITGTLTKFEARPPKILCLSDVSAVAREDQNMILPIPDPVDPRISTYHQMLPRAVHGHLNSVSTTYAHTAPYSDIHELLQAIDLLPPWNASSDVVQDVYRRLLTTDQIIVDQLYALKFPQNRGSESSESRSESPPRKKRHTWNLWQWQILGRTLGKKTNDNSAKKHHDDDGDTRKSVYNPTTTSDNLDRNAVASGANGPGIVPAVMSPMDVARTSGAKFRKLDKLDALLSPIQRNELKHARRFFKNRFDNQSSERTLRLKLLEGAETLLANALEAFWNDSHGLEWRVR